MGKLYDLTDNKVKQLREREEIVKGSNQAIREAWEKDWQEIREELQREYKYIREN
ncbi:hypothetical protein ES705_37167 [subsurface metagenome]